MIRPYQVEFINAVKRDLVEFDRVLGVAATGSGKTVMSGILARDFLAYGPVLFLADAEQLVTQAAEKLTHWSGAITDIEMGKHRAMAGGSNLVVGTTQSMARRLTKWPRGFFKLIIIDEAHRNTLGSQAMAVLSHFDAAQVVGITATPYRSDKRQLGEFYQKISIEIGLVRLIKEGYLSPITIKSVPVGIDISNVHTKNGDYRDDELGAAIEPYLDKLATVLNDHAFDRRTVAFFPLIDISKKFVAACESIGIKAIHVDGNDKAGVSLFSDKHYDVICCSQLLSTGWDEPSVDCVFICRPTQSATLYSQMVGRGTRICEGKKDLLLLDPLYIAEQDKLIRPARLLAKTAEEAVILQRVIDSKSGDGYGQIDLLDAEEIATNDRNKSLRIKILESAKKKPRTIDAMEFALSLGELEMADYEPEMAWEAKPVTAGQHDYLVKQGFSADDFRCAGHASKMIDLLVRRRDMKLATPKQIRYLKQFRHPTPYTVTFEEASAFLDSKFTKPKQTTNV